MPTKFEQAPSAQRKDRFDIDPAEVVVDPALNARRDGIDADHVRRLAYSFLHEGGQKVPVQVRREAGRPKLVAGYHRHAAALLINTELQPDNPVKLMCVFAEGNEEEAFRDSIVENRRARRTTAVDDAHNQRRLRDVYKWSDQQIAALYDTTPGDLAKVATLLELPKAVQDKVAAGTLAVSGAVALAALPPGERDAALAAAAPSNGHGNGRLRGETIREAVRQKKRDEGKKAARGYAEVKAAIAAWADDESKSVHVRDFARAFGRFCAGEAGERVLLNVLAEW